MSWWEVLDVSGWPELQGEPRGLRAKRWITDPQGRLWLRKSIRAWHKVPGGSRPTEPAIEAFTLELARRCGLLVAHGRAAVWQLDAAPVRGFASLKFHDDTEQQFTGAELMPDAATDSPDTRIAATLPRIYERLAQLEHRGYHLVAPFVRMLVFDAWIGNGDRHLGNWAVLTAGPAKRFAPMFDTAGCLGTELRDDHRLFSGEAATEDVVAYAHGCKSGFGDGVSRAGISQDEVMQIAHGWPEWKPAYEQLVPRFQELLSSEVDGMLAAVPDEWWPVPRRRFARRLLSARAKILEGAVP